MNMQTNIESDASTTTAETVKDCNSYTATYSPDDNKLRLYSLHRLDSETYAEAKRLGFKWAPKQELFVAPMWTPAREDFLVKLCGEIDDEDTSLIDRAEDRADRFETYSDKRASEADRAHRAVRAIADNIPFGQPILVGHHSERRARKDAEKIENGMRRAVNLFETSEYWTRRAAGALAHAKYKELPDVRYRRIKKIESEKRKQEREIKDAKTWLAAWSKEDLTHEQALSIANYSRLHLPRKEGDKPDFNQRPSAYSALSNSYPNLYAPRSLSEIVDYAKKSYPRFIAHLQRWVDHYNNRLNYEKAMLGEQGGLAADKFPIEVGGMVLARGEWITVVRINRVNGAISSVTTNSRYVSVRSIEEVSDYRAPTAEQKKAVAKAMKLPPLCNYPGEGFLHITAKDWDDTYKDYKGTQKQAANDQQGAHRVRFIIKAGKWVSVFITDKPRKDAPKPIGQDCAPVLLQREAVLHTYAPTTPEPNPLRESVEGMKQALKAGVKAVSAPQLFQTPNELADRIIDDAEPADGLRWLEPSAGPGRLCQAIFRAVDTAELVAVDVSPQVAGICAATNKAAKVITADFLELSVDEIGSFDRVVMNPPFVDAVDIKHIKKAASLLNQGGILMAICAHGPRQVEALAAWARDSGGYFEKLPEGSFKDAGTNVSTALLQYRR